MKVYFQLSENKLETTNRFVFLIYMENCTFAYIYYHSSLRSALYTFLIFWYVNVEYEGNSLFIHFKLSAFWVYSVLIYQELFKNAYSTKNCHWNDASRWRMNASNAFKNNWSQDLILKHMRLILELGGGVGKMANVNFSLNFYPVYLQRQKVRSEKYWKYARSAQKMSWCESPSFSYLSIQF